MLAQEHGEFEKSCASIREDVAVLEKRESEINAIDQTKDYVVKLNYGFNDNDNQNSRTITTIFSEDRWTKEFVLVKGANFCEPNKKELDIKVIIGPQLNTTPQVCDTTHIGPVLSISESGPLMPPRFSPSLAALSNQTRLNQIRAECPGESGERGPNNDQEAELEIQCKDDGLEKNEGEADFDGEEDDIEFEVAKACSMGKLMGFLAKDYKEFTKAFAKIKKRK